MAVRIHENALLVAHPTVGERVPAYIRRDTNTLVLPLTHQDVLAIIAELAKNYQDQSAMTYGTTLVIESDTGFYPKEEL